MIGCFNVIYIGYSLERNVILIFKFRIVNEIICVNEIVEVRGRFYDVLVRIEIGNGMVEILVERVIGNYLMDEVYEI